MHIPSLSLTFSDPYDDVYTFSRQSDNAEYPDSPMIQSVLIYFEEKDRVSKLELLSTRHSKRPLAIGRVAV